MRKLSQITSYPTLSCNYKIITNDKFSMTVSFDKPNINLRVIFEFEMLTCPTNKPSIYRKPMINNIVQ